MRLCRTVFLVALSVAFFSAYSAYAAVFNGNFAANNTIRFYGDDNGLDVVRRSGNGGEFLAYNTDGIRQLTFCLEMGEHLDFSNPYTAYSITNYAEKGGVDSDALSPSNRDNISKGTGYLFEQFYKYVENGTSALDSVFYDASGTANDGFYTRSGTNALTDSWGQAVQLAIWRLEDETTHPSYPGATDLGAHDIGRAQAIYDWITGFFGSEANAKSDYTGTLVQVLNIKGPNSSNTLAQSQLIINEGGTPGDIPSVPEPATLAIWSLGLGIAGLVKLRRRKIAA